MDDSYARFEFGHDATVLSEADRPGEHSRVREPERHHLATPRHAEDLGSIQNAEVREPADELVNVADNSLVE